MWCPRCISKTIVLSTIKSFNNERYRKCIKCRLTFTTIEKLKDNKNIEKYKNIVDEIEKTSKQISTPKQKSLF